MSVTERAAPAQSPPSTRVAASVTWTLRFLLALFLFVGALQVMKMGAAKLDILKEGGFLVRNAASTLGLGWLVLLAFFYIPIRRGVWKFQRQMVKSKPRLAGFTAGLFLIPLAIVAIAGWSA